MSPIEKRNERKLNQPGLLAALSVAIFDELLIREQHREEEDKQGGYSSQPIKGRCPVDSSRSFVDGATSTKVTRYERSECSLRNSQGVF
jgi:hypothetical protein